MNFAAGSLLAQVKPAVTTAVTLYTAVLRTEITLFLAVVIPGSAGNIDIDIYHDDDGTTYDDSTLIGSIQRADNADGLTFQAQCPGSGIMIARGGTIGVKISTADDINFSMYGITESLAADRLRT